ncbi:MAG: CHAD domain-containing protein [Actinomycetota bacterium]
MAPEDAIVPAEPENPRAGDHCGAVLLHLLEVLGARADAFVEGREVEPLHQLRVSARRLRAALSFFEPICHGDEDLERARRRIRKLALPFGQLRDLDVFLEHLDDGVAPVAPADCARLRKVLVKRRDHLADDVVRELGKKRWHRELRRVRDGATAGTWRDSPAAVVDARRFASERLDLWWWALLAGSEGLEAMTPGRRHRVRIEAKKLRYATEVTAELFADREPEAFTDGLKDIQDALGALNDRAVAESIVREAGFEPTAALDEGEDVSRALAARAGLVAQGPHWEGIPR